MPKLSFSRTFSINQYFDVTFYWNTKWQIKVKFISKQFCQNALVEKSSKSWRGQRKSVITLWPEKRTMSKGDATNQMFGISRDSIWSVPHQIMWIKDTFLNDFNAHCGCKNVKFGNTKLNINLPKQKMVLFLQLNNDELTKNWTREGLVP